jgi:hypothetical protein
VSKKHSHAEPTFSPNVVGIDQDVDREVEEFARRLEAMTVPANRTKLPVHPSLASLRV